MTARQWWCALGLGSSGVLLIVLGTIGKQESLVALGAMCCGFTWGYIEGRGAR